MTPVATSVTPASTPAEALNAATALAAGNGATALIDNMHASVTGALAGIPDEVALALGVPETFFGMRDRVLWAAAEGALCGVAMSERGAGSRLSHRVDTDPGTPETNRWIWRAKLVAGETAADVGASVLEACGTAATRRGNPLERLYRDARCGSPATSDVCADCLGFAVLGCDPERDAEVPRW